VVWHGARPFQAARRRVHIPLLLARRRYAAALLGLSNTAGALPGVLGVTAAGYLLDTTGSWAHALFLPTAACQIFGLIVYSLFASSKRQDWE
jgi:ACS family sodium-dependent inorganic phosphate cotransporter